MQTTLVIGGTGNIGLPHTFIRPSFFMQNLSTTHLADIQQNRDLFIPAGSSKTSFIDTRDIGEAAAICLTDPQYIGQKLNITGSEAITYQQAAETMTAVLGTPITYSKPSLIKFHHEMRQRGLPRDYVNVMTMLYLITQLGNAKQVTETLPRILKRPSGTVAEFVADYRVVFLKEDH